MACCGTRQIPAGFPARRAATESANPAPTFVTTSALWGQTVQERIVNACVQALHDVQDYIDEASHDPWPGDRTPPRPPAEIQGAKVLLGYGTPEAPMLECEPIPLDTT